MQWTEGGRSACSVYAVTVLTGACCYMRAVAAQNANLKYVLACLSTTILVHYYFSDVMFASKVMKQKVVICNKSYFVTRRN